MNIFNLEIFLLISFFLYALSFTRIGFWSYSIASLTAIVIGIFCPSGVFNLELGFFVRDAFAFDSYRQLFFLIISGLGFIIGLYSKNYFNSKSDAQKFYGLVGLFQWSCLLTVVSNHFFLLALAWEFTSIISYLLIGFDRRSKEAQKGAIQAFLVTSLGGLSLIAAAVLIQSKMGNIRINEFIAHADILKDITGIKTILWLLMTAIVTKSAIFPFHFWLPGAMKAPTPVSAYLHSATLVKLGVFLTGLFWGTFNGLPVWHIVLSGAGLLSFAWGAAMALFQKDLKSGLAHTTFSQLGLIVMLFAQRSELAFAAGIMVLVAHALYKSSLFLSVGIFQKLIGSQDLKEISGIGKISKGLWFIVGISCLSMAGAPPFLGFLGKEMTLEILSGPFVAQGAQIFSWICFAVGALATIAFAILFGTKPFVGSEPELKKTASPLLIWSLIPAAILTMLFSFVLFPFKKIVLDRGAQIPETLGIPLSHGLNLGLGISFAFLIIGGGIAFLLYKWPQFWQIKAEYDWRIIKISTYFQKIIFQYLESISDFLVRRSLHISDYYAIGSLIAAYLAFTFYFLPPNRPMTYEIFNLNHGILIVSLFVAAVLSVVAYAFQNIAVSIFIVSAIGYVIAYSFAVFGAPDLVLTQLLIETASLILMILAWLNFRRESSKQKWDTGLWALSSLTSIAVLFAFYSLKDPGFEKLSSLYFFENAKDFAFGTNLVNVIIVDFRGLDTLGEISVLAIAYLACEALCSRIQSLPKEIAAYPATTHWMKQMSKLFVFALVAFGVFYLLRGHHLPGGGFIGGLLCALALFVRMIVFAKKSHSLTLTGCGLFIAYLAALFPLLLGKEFFESFKTVFGPSSLFFDIGVFFVVAGSISGILALLIRFRVESWKKLRDSDV